MKMSKAVKPVCTQEGSFDFDYPSECLKCDNHVYCILQDIKYLVKNAMIRLPPVTADFVCLIEKSQRAKPGGRS